MIVLFVFYGIFHVTTLRKPKKKLQNVAIKPSPRKVIVEWILRAWNDISCEIIRKSFKSCALTTALDGDEDDQIQSFKPEENPFVAILGDIAEAIPTKMLIDEDEGGRRRDWCIIILLWCIIWDFLIIKSNSI